MQILNIILYNIITLFLNLNILHLLHLLLNYHNFHYFIYINTYTYYNLTIKSRN